MDMKIKRKCYVTLIMLATVLGLAACSGMQESDQPTSGVKQKKAGNEIKSTTAESVGTIIYTLPSEAEEADIYVEPIDNLSEDFMRGVDISSIIAEEESGVVYYNEDGIEQDIFETLAQHGVNYIRVRVWNDPYDADGNSYGGGHNDTETAAEIGRRAAKYGIKLCVDYHYSDFWADPSKQMCPKAWEGMEIEEKAEALRQFTEESLTQILDAGALVGMVQIGNEINNGIAGEKEWSRRRKLLSAGSEAVREVAADTGTDILIAVHFTDVNDKDGIMDMAKKLELEGKEIDYDVFAVSYYPFWHGSMDNLTDVLREVSETYGKKVVVAENSYLYTTDDGDGTGNSVGEGSVVAEYPATVQGQANEIRDVCAAVAAVGDAGLGFFYWEPAWIPVGVWEENTADADRVLEENKKIWEEYGSGWASSYAGTYDPKDAGVYYGGSSWDNQALFDYYGHPLESLKVFRYLHCGTIVEKQVESIPLVEVDVGLGAEVEMPETVDVVFNDRSVIPVAVKWDEDMVAAIDTSVSGTYDVRGTFVLVNDLLLPIDSESNEDNEEDGAFSQEVIDTLMNSQPTAHVNVARVNLLANSSFEDPDTSMWNITGGGTDYQNKSSDAHSGDYSLHFWSTSDIFFTVEQQLTGLKPGTYEFGVCIQGGDADGADIYIYADNGQVCLTEATEVTSWCDWHNPVISEITVDESGMLAVGVSVTAPAKAWGTIDDLYLYQK